MTTLAKLLVCLALVLGIGMLAWALGLYVSQRPGESIEGAAGKPAAANKGNKAQREVFERDAKLNALLQSLTESEARWETPHAALIARQPSYYLNPPWYEAQLAELESSKGDLVSVQYQAGRPVLDAKNYGRPLMEPAAYPPLTSQEKQQGKKGESLKSASLYRQKTEEEKVAHQKASQDLVKLYAEDAQLTDILAGKEGSPDKGLWLQLAEEKHKHQQIKAEAIDLRDVWTKIQVDGGLLLRRLEQMQEREAELQGKMGTKTAAP